MKVLHSESFQKKFLIGYLVLAVAILLFCMAYFEMRDVNSWVVRCFNFLSHVDSSGFLVFVGVAAGLVYIKSTYFFYRSGVFVFGMFFSISQAVIGAVGEITVSSVLAFTLVATAVLGGIGIMIFSFLAMAVYEYEIKKRGVDGSNLSKNDQFDSTKKLDQKVKENFNLNPSLKNDSAQPSPAPSDLAHDLRYSRSRARRSRAQR